jgi:hypothetical protein
MSSHELPEHYDVTEVLRRIKRGDNRQLIQKIRNEENKTVRDRLKKQLLWICFSGKFSQRLNDAMIQHSGLICLDFDGMDQRNLMLWRKKVVIDPHTYSCFISPSGNGLKVLVKIPPCKTNEEHNRRFDSLAEYWGKCQYFDKNVKGWNRVCFESYDPDIYINPGSEIYEGIAAEQSIIPVSVPGVPISEYDEVFRRLVTWFESKYNLSLGNRNQGAFTFASAVADYIPETQAENMIFDYISRNVEQAPGDPFTPGEIRQCIKSAYFHHPVPTKQMTSAPVYDAVNVDNSLVEIDGELPAPEMRKKIIFWYQTKNGSTEIDFFALKRFLQDNHFFRYDLNAKEFVFIRIENNTVEQVEVWHIKDFILKTLENWGESMVYNVIAKNSKMRKDYLNYLDARQIVWLEDTKTESYVFYRNNAVRVTSSGMEVMDYSSLNGYIWKSQKKDRDFQISDYDCDAATFVKNVCNNDTNRIRSYCSGLGYLLHSYKDMSKMPAVILTDEIISQEPCGGSGKGLTMKMIGQIRTMEVFDGKNFNTGKSFPWQRVGLDTQVILIDDVPKNFDFEKLFSIITEGIPIEKKNMQEIYLSFKESPKVAINTNTVIKGESTSHQRRKFELELYPHYTIDKQPIDDFGRAFFDGWDNVEWLRFDNFMLNCLRLYLKEGLIVPKYVNLKYKKLEVGTHQFFPAWAEDNLHRGQQYKRNDILDSFKIENGIKDNYPRSTEFLRWIRLWGDYKGWRAVDCGSGKMSVKFLLPDEKMTDDESEMEIGTLPF